MSQETICDSDNFLSIARRRSKRGLWLKKKISKERNDNRLTSLLAALQNLPRKKWIFVINVVSPFFAKCILLVAAAGAAEAAEAEAEVDSHGNVLNDRPANRKCLTDR